MRAQKIIRRIYSMKHDIKIGVFKKKKPSADSIVSSRTFKMRERVLRWLLGDVRRVTVILASDQVSNITIQEVAEV